MDCRVPTFDIRTWSPSSTRRRQVGLALIAMGSATFLPSAAWCQDANQGFELPAMWLALAIIPALLAVTTCFLKFSVVLGFLRKALNLEDVLPALVLAAFAGLLTFFVMGPTTTSAYSAYSEASGTPFERLSVVWEPIKAWLGAHASTAEIDTLVRISGELGEAPLAADSPQVLATAFALTELQEAFIIGLALILPFVVVDFVTASALKSFGVEELDPKWVAVPFKVLLFVLVDGWSLLIEGLMLGYVVPA